MSLLTDKPMSTRAKPAVMLVVCACLAQVMVVLDTTIIAVALPDAQAGLGFSNAGRQWTITAYTLAFGSLLLVGGRLSQFLGIRRAFLLGLSGFAVASFLGGVASSFEMLIAARVGQGIFAALLAPTNLSLMNTAFPDRHNRAKAFAIFGAVAGAGAALGLILGGALTESLSWRWCLYVNVPLALLTGVLAWYRLHSVPGPTASQLTADLLGLVLGTTGLFSLVFGFSRAEENGWNGSETMLFLGSGVLLLIVFLLREKRASAPILPLSILADPVRASSYLAIAMVGLAQMGSSIYLTFYFQNNLDYSPLRTGISFLPMVGGLVLAALVSTRVLVPRLGLRFVYPAGAGIQAIGLWRLSYLDPASSYTSSVLVPAIIIGLGLGTVMAPAMSAATRGVSVEHSGLASAAANTSQQIGASLGVAFLSTYAAQRATDFLNGKASTIQDAIATGLAARQPAPGSAEAAQLADGIKQQFLAQAEISAYAAGFAATALIAATLAVVTLVLLLATRSGGAAAEKAVAQR